MAVIFSASTSLGSPSYTERLIRPFLLWFNPHMSEETIGLVHAVVRKCAHVCEYLVFGILVWRALHFDRGFLAAGEGRQYWLAILICALYASTDEFHQIFVATRHPAVLDVMLDTFGAGLGLFLTWCARRLLKAIA